MREREGGKEREREGGRGRERRRKKGGEEESMSITLEKCTHCFENFVHIFWPYLQLHGERNYHIFYRLLAGMPANKLAKLHLSKDPWAYSYLTKVSIDLCKT